MAEATNAKTGIGIGLQARSLVHSYPGMPPVVQVDRLEMASGEAVALTGPSGSGKTTLLYLLTGIEPIRQGIAEWRDIDLAGLSERRRDSWRRSHVGFVFQDFHLVPGLSIIDNVLITAYFAAFRPMPAQVERGRMLLETLAVPTERRAVTDLSRGEQQRVAIARAMLNQPPIVVADEPTASLDADSSRQVIDSLLSQVRAAGATLLTVTHDPLLVDAVDTVYALERGRLIRAK